LAASSEDAKNLDELLHQTSQVLEKKKRKRKKDSLLGAMAARGLDLGMPSSSTIEEGDSDKIKKKKLKLKYKEKRK